MVEHLLELIKGTHLNLNLQFQTFLFEILMTTVYRIRNTTGKVYVVILQQDHIEKSDTVVTSSTDLHGLLLQHTHARGGLTGIKHTGLRAFQVLHVLVGHRGDTTHTLHDVQHQTLRLEQ